VAATEPSPLIRIPQNSLNPAAPDVLDILGKLPKPTPRLVGTAARAPGQNELDTGSFLVDGKPVILQPPIDWRQDPFLSRSWRFQLNTLSWLKPLLVDHSRSGNRNALAVAKGIVVDWATAHTPVDVDNEFAWYDMVVGLRSPYISYTLRACLLEKMLDESDALLLLGSAERHGVELATPENHAGRHNHALFQDEGLYLLARQLPALAAAGTWRRLALTRLRSTLNETICVAEGGHLEHSSSYQFSITALVARLAVNVPELDELTTLLDRLTATSHWHVTPANRMAQLGDTDDVQAPQLASPNARKPHGLNALFNTGRAFVRKGNSYLAVSAAHHSSAHKQADDTGFLLIENREVILGDAGRWSYHEEEADRVYARTAAAHNVLFVDGLDFQWRRTDPYGSGLLAAGEGNGWYAIAACNPTLRQQEVEHRRLLLYRPMHVLLVVDEVTADAQHDYVRHFHLGPEMTATLSGNRVLVSGEKLSASLVDHSEGTAVSLCRGQDRPTRLGWTYPADHVRTAVSTAILRTRAARALLTTSLTLGASPSTLSAIEGGGDRFFFRFNDLSRVETSLDLRRKEIRIVSWAAPPH